MKSQRDNSAKMLQPYIFPEGPVIDIFTFFSYYIFPSVFNKYFY